MSTRYNPAYQSYPLPAAPPPPPPPPDTVGFSLAGTYTDRWTAFMTAGQGSSITQITGGIRITAGTAVTDATAVQLWSKNTAEGPHAIKFRAIRRDTGGGADSTSMLFYLCCQGKGTVDKPVNLNSWTADGSTRFELDSKGYRVTVGPLGGTAANEHQIRLNRLDANNTLGTSLIGTSSTYNTNPGVFIFTKDVAYDCEIHRTGTLFKFIQKRVSDGETKTLEFTDATMDDYALGFVGIRALFKCDWEITNFTVVPIDLPPPLIDPDGFEFKDDYEQNWQYLSRPGTILEQGVDAVTLKANPDLALGDGAFATLVSRLAFTGDFEVTYDLTRLDSIVGSSTQEGFLFYFSLIGDGSAGHPVDLLAWDPVDGSTRFEHYGKGYRASFDGVNNGALTEGQVRLRAFAGGGNTTGTVIIGTGAPNTTPGSFPFTKNVKFNCVLRKEGTKFNFKYKPASGSTWTVLPEVDNANVATYKSGRFIWRMMAGRSATIGAFRVTAISAGTPSKDMTLITTGDDAEKVTQLKIMASGVDADNNGQRKVIAGVQTPVMKATDTILCIGSYRYSIPQDDYSVITTRMGLMALEDDTLGQILTEDTGRNNREPENPKDYQLQGAIVKPASGGPKWLNLAAFAGSTVNNGQMIDILQDYAWVQGLLVPSDIDVAKTITHFKSTTGLVTSMTIGVDSAAATKYVVCSVNLGALKANDLLIVTARSEISTALTPRTAILGQVMLSTVTGVTTGTELAETTGKDVALVPVQLDYIPFAAMYKVPAAMPAAWLNFWLQASGSSNSGQTIGVTSGRTELACIKVSE